MKSLWLAIREFRATWRYDCAVHRLAQAARARVDAENELLRTSEWEQHESILFTRAAEELQKVRIEVKRAKRRRVFGL